MEIPLSGGRMTEGVVRLAGTVRRPKKESSSCVRNALRALRSAGFYRTPEFLGFDEKNREVLSFIEGYVPADLGENSVEQFYMAVDMARDLHQTSKAFAPEGLVLCHDDFSPCNTVFSAPCGQNGSYPKAIIDWDACAFLPAWEEIGYMCWLWLDLGNQERDAELQINAMGRALEIYGANAAFRADFPGKLIRRMMRVQRSVETGGVGDVEGVREWVGESVDWVNRHRMEIVRRIEMQQTRRG